MCPSYRKPDDTYRKIDGFRSRFYCCCNRCSFSSYSDCCSSYRPPVEKVYVKPNCVVTRFHD